MRVAVIGAGPAGLTAALKLQQGGASVDVFEANEHVGGLSRSMKLWDQTVDLGPHRFFSRDARVNQFWLDIVGNDYRMVDRLTRIHYNERLFDYPLRVTDVVRKLGMVESARCVLSCLQERVLPTTVREKACFETWVVRRFGRRLFQTFFQSYSEKLWGIPCTSLSDDFAAQRIRSLTLWQAIKSALTTAITSSNHHPTSHRTLVDQFAYPIHGTGDVYQRIATRFQELGGQLHLKSPVDCIQLDQNRLVGLRKTNGESHAYDEIISTMPLTRLVESIQQNGTSSCPNETRNAAKKLKFRNTILVYLNVDDPNVFDDQWRYIHSPNVNIGRVSNFRNWVGQLYGKSRTTILCAERWCDPSDQVWNARDEELIAQAKQELRTIGILENQNILNGKVIRIPRCYPVYEVGYRDHVSVIADHLKSIRGLHVIGRYGAFKYNNQDHSILTGLLAAENILNRAGHNLWDINSDFDSYQEMAVITEKGLSDCGEATQSLPSKNTIMPSVAISVPARNATTSS